MTPDPEHYAPPEAHEPYQMAEPVRRRVTLPELPNEEPEGWDGDEGDDPWPEDDFVPLLRRK